MRASASACSASLRADFQSAVEPLELGRRRLGRDRAGRQPQAARVEHHDGADRDPGADGLTPQDLHRHRGGARGRVRSSQRPHARIPGKRESRGRRPAPIDSGAASTSRRAPPVGEFAVPEIHEAGSVRGWTSVGSPFSSSWNRAETRSASASTAAAASGPRLQLETGAALGGQGRQIKNTLAVEFIAVVMHSDLGLEL